MPINITLSAREAQTLTGIFEIFSTTMKRMEVEVPIELKRDMANILQKMVDRLMDQMARDN
jgi:hypothetical protein